MIFIHAVRLKYLRIAHGYVMRFNARKVQSYIFPSLISSHQITSKKDLQL